MGQISHFRRKLKIAGIVKDGKKNLMETGNRSVSIVWGTQDTAKSSAAAGQSKGFGKKSKTEQAKLYVEEIKKFQKDREEERIAFENEMNDTQDMEVSKSQAFRAGIVQEAREARKRDIAENALILVKKEEDRKAQMKVAFHKSKKDQRRKDELERAEKARLADLISWKENKWVYPPGYSLLPCELSWYFRDQTVH